MTTMNKDTKNANITSFTLDGAGYAKNEKTGYCFRYVDYPVEGGRMHRQSLRISKREYNAAYEKWIDTLVEKAEEDVATEEGAELLEEIRQQERESDEGMTYEQLIELAKEYYNEGGDGIVECWDENTYNEYVKEFGPLTKEKAFGLFGADADTRANAEYHNQQATPKKAPRKKKVHTGGMEFSEDGVDVILTEKQVKFIQLLPMTQFWDSGVDSSLWVDVLCDELAAEMGPMTVGAMVSTLREKHLLYVAVGAYGENTNSKGRKAKYIAFTELGKKVVAKVLGL